VVIRFCLGPLLFLLPLVREGGMRMYAGEVDTESTLNTGNWVYGRCFFSLTGELAVDWQC
jgi:hypothetical protein